MQKPPIKKEMITISELQKKWPGLTDWMLAKGIDDRLGTQQDDEGDESVWADFPRPYSCKKRKGKGKIGKDTICSRKPEPDFPFPYDREAIEPSRPYQTAIKSGIVQYTFTDALFLLSEVEQFELSNQFVFNESNNIRIIIDNNISDMKLLENKFNSFQDELKEKNRIIEKLEKELRAKKDHIQSSRGDPGTIKRLTTTIQKWKEIIPTFVLLAMECQREVYCPPLTAAPL